MHAWLTRLSQYHSQVRNKTPLWQLGYGKYQRARRYWNELVTLDGFVRVDSFAYRFPVLDMIRPTIIHHLQPDLDRIQYASVRGINRYPAK